MKRWSEFLSVGILLILALAMREFESAPSAGSTWFLARGCGEALLPQVLSNLQSHNPLHFETFFYPPVPAIIVASAARLWGILGGGGTVTGLCGTVGLMFELATVALVYMLGRFWGQSYGLIAMALYAVTMAAVVVNGNVQVYSAFFVSLAMYCVLRAAKGQPTRIPTWAGVWLGLGVASKYSPLFFSGLLFVPTVIGRWLSGRSIAVKDSKPEPSVHDPWLPRLWLGALCTSFFAMLVALWLGVAKRGFVYGLLRRVYEQHSHENPFEYHLPWIDRLYRAGLMGVGLAGLVVGLAIILPWLKKESPWESARAVFARNRLWMVPCIVFALTLIVALGLPVALNLNDFTRHLVHVAKGRGSGDNGFFPANSPAPSYIGAYIPEGTGIPLFFAGLIGIFYAVIRRDRILTLLIVSAIPAYLALDLMHVKVMIYALDLLPLWCLLAAIWLGDLCHQRRQVLRVVGIALVASTVVYSTLYSLAWASFFSPRNSAQVQAGKWLNANLTSGTSVGARSAVMVTGSPSLLPEVRYLEPYRLADYTEGPEYVLLPNGLHAIMVQYFENLRKGYVYTMNDWFLSTPTPADLEALSHIVREDGYLIVKEFRSRPRIFGMEFASDSLTGRTWMAEHSSAIGLKIYRRAAKHS